MKKAHRITSGQEYREVIRKGRKLTNPYAFVYVRPRTMGADLHILRFGFVTTRKLGKAVVRNRMRRRLKGVGCEILRRWKDHAEMANAGYDIIFYIRPAAVSAKYAQLEEELCALVVGELERSEEREQLAEMRRAAAREEERESVGLSGANTVRACESVSVVAGEEVIRVRTRTRKCDRA